MLRMIGNFIWFIFAGLWLALANIIKGVLCCITIIGIPFGLQCFKLAGASLVPIGKTVVTNELAASAMKANAEKELEQLRSKDDVEEERRQEEEDAEEGEEGQGGGSGEGGSGEGRGREGGGSREEEPGAENHRQAPGRSRQGSRRALRLITTVRETS